MNRMKTIRISFLALLFIVVAGCKKDIPDIGKQYSPKTGINGTWKLSAVTLVDLSTPIPEEMDVSSYYTSASNQLTLQIDYAAGTYSVPDPGSAINFFGTGGTWTYDEGDYPSAVTFYTSDMDTVSTELNAMVRDYDPTLGLNYTRTKCDAPNVTYQFTFTRQ